MYFTPYSKIMALVHGIFANECLIGSNGLATLAPVTSLFTHLSSFATKPTNSLIAFKRMPSCKTN